MSGSFKTGAEQSRAFSSLNALSSGLLGAHSLNGKFSFLVNENNGAAIIEKSLMNLL